MSPARRCPVLRAALACVACGWLAGCAGKIGAVRFDDGWIITLPEPPSGCGSMYLVEPRRVLHAGAMGVWTCPAGVAVRSSEEAGSLKFSVQFSPFPPTRRLTCHLDEERLSLYLTRQVVFGPGEIALSWIQRSESGLPEPCEAPPRPGIDERLESRRFRFWLDPPAPPTPAPPQSPHTSPPA